MMKGFKTRVAGSTLAMLLCTGLASAMGNGQVENRWQPPEIASTYGHRYDDLFMLITTLVSVSFVIVCVMLAAAVFKFRSKPGRKAHYDNGNSLHDKRFTAIVSVTVFLVLDAWVLVIAMGDLREGVYAIPELGGVEDVMQVEVLGQQWAWNFRTTGEDGVFGTADDVVTINDLTVPVDTPISFNITSKDVIHAFSLPAMRFKRDLTPGAINLAWFEVIKAGDYDILCQELCGVSHYQMVGVMHTLEQDEFEAWNVEASRLAEFAYDKDDTEAHWAWDWEIR